MRQSEEGGCLLEKNDIILHITPLLLLRLTCRQNRRPAASRNRERIEHWKPELASQRTPGWRPIEDMNVLPRELPELFRKRTALASESKHQQGRTPDGLLYHAAAVCPLP